MAGPDEPRDGASAERIGYLDSVRALAALQVLLLHSFAAFAPGLVFWWASPTPVEWAIHASPLYLLYAGSPAVYVFFGLSGIVLTRAYARSSARAWTQIPARALRLGIPAAAACLASFAIVSVIGTPSTEAAAEIGSTWLSGQLAPFAGLGFLLKEIFVNSLLLGYAGMSAPSFVGLAGMMDPVSAAYVGPLWTLSVEMLGSLLILLLTVVRRRSTLAWTVLLVLSAALLFRSYFICFVIGHLLALPLSDRRPPPLPRWAGWVLVIAGLATCLAAEFMQPAMAACTWALPFAFPCTLILDQIIGASLLLVGLCFVGPARKFHSSKWLARLGRISFPLYLVHWPIVIGIGSVVLLALAPLTGPAVARSVAIVTSIGLSVGAAILFVPVDDFAMRCSHWVRNALSRVRPPTMGEA